MSQDDDWWKNTWPLDWRDVGILVAWLAVVITTGVLIGEILTNWSVLDGLVDLDQRIAEDLANGRTQFKNDLADWGSFIADTPVKIAFSIIVAGALMWYYRRWHEAAMIGIPLIFEATAFIVISFIVGRPRPDVERLLDSPVDTTFPSGHVAAATVYASFAVIVFWHTTALWARALAVLGAVAAPLIVGWSRMYQGMHYLTDVIAGIVLGAASVLIVWSVLGAPPPDDDRSEALARGAHAR